MTSQQIAQQIIDEAPNKDWKRPFTIKSDKIVNFNHPHTGEIMKGRIIYVQFAEGIKKEGFASQFSPSYEFAGFIINFIPKAYLKTTDVILLSNGETFEHKIMMDFLGRIEGIQRNLKHKGCPVCKSLRDMVTKRGRRLGPEAVQIIYTCKDCGHKEFDVFD